MVRLLTYQKPLIVDYTILLKKLELYGIRGNNHNWIKSSLSNRKQYIERDPIATTSLELVKCGVPQGSILVHLLLLLYVNDLKNALNLFNPIISADDTNLFYTHKNTNWTFFDVNKELTNINEWFVANKFFLNDEKARYSLFFVNLVRRTIFLSNYQIYLLIIIR